MRVRAEFQRCYEQGRKYHSRYFLLFFLPDSGPCPLRGPRLGIAASRKVGTAVQRNRFKRLIRESFRLNRELFPGNADIVIVVKRGVNPMQLKLADIQKDLRIVLQRVSREVRPPAEPVSRDEIPTGKIFAGSQADS